MSRPITGEQDIGEPTITRAYVKHPLTGDAVLPTDVESIKVVAWHKGRKLQFWEYDLIDPNEEADQIATMYDEPQTADNWSSNDLGYTFLSVIPYGGETNAFRPPAGQELRLEFVFTLLDGFHFSIKRDVKYEGVRAISSGVVAT